MKGNERDVEKAMREDVHGEEAPVDSPLKEEDATQIERSAQVSDWIGKQERCAQQELSVDMDIRVLVCTCLFSCHTTTGQMVLCCSFVEGEVTIINYLNESANQYVADGLQCALRAQK